MLTEEIRNIRKLDPYRFTDDINLGVFEIRDFMLKGLSSLTNTTRMDTFCFTNDQMMFNTTLRMRNLRFYKSLTLNLFIFEQTRFLRMNISAIDCNLRIFINTGGGVLFTVMTSVSANEEDFKVEYDGPDALNSLANLFLEFLFKTFKGIIESIIERQLIDTLRENLEIIFYT